jgi:hypothetical protein
MRIAYIISAYKLPDLLIRIVERLQSGDATFLIHIDKKTPAAIFEVMRRGLKDYSNVYFLKRHNCYWGDFSHVEATLKGIHQVLKRQVSFDYAILLTGQDYPIKTNDEIASILNSAEGKSYIEWSSLPCTGWKNGGTDRFEYWYLSFGRKRWVFPMEPWGGKLRFVPEIVNAVIPRLRRFLPGLKPFGGSGYWCLSNKAVHYIAEYLNHNPQYARFFKTCFVPDEMFFQTLLCNSHLRDEIINDNMRYIDWSAMGKHPKVIIKDDFSQLRSSSKLFARKFDTSIDSQILDMIDQEMLLIKEQ